MPCPTCQRAVPCIPRLAPRCSHMAHGASARTRTHTSVSTGGRASGRSKEEEEEEEEEASVRRTRADHRAVPLNGDQVAE